MAYATENDLIPRRLAEQEAIELTNDSGGSSIDSTVIADVLTEGSALIDSYCRQRYTVPLQQSDQVKALALDVGLYKLFLRRRRVPEEVQLAYDNAVSFLKDVATGRAGLDQPTGATAQLSGGEAKKTDVAERFSDDNLGGYTG
jgi:phage gp36-like protein